MLKIDMGLVYTIINLVILYLLLKRFLIGPVTAIMEERERRINESLQHAQDEQADALKMKLEYETALSGARQESVQIIENARKNAKSEYDRIVEEASDRAEQIIESAKETVRVERDRTLLELKSEIAGLAMASAEKIIGKKTGDQGDRELYDQFLKETGEEHGNENG